MPINFKDAELQNAKVKILKHYAGKTIDPQVGRAVQRVNLLCKYPDLLKNWLEKKKSHIQLEIIYGVTPETIKRHKRKALEMFLEEVNKT